MPRLIFGVIMIFGLGGHFHRSVCLAESNQLTIHQLWPSLRGVQDLPSTTEPSFESRSSSVNLEKHTSVQLKQSSLQSKRSKTMVVYGSPICVGRCLILQIYWSNSSKSFLQGKFSVRPSFKKSRLT